MRGALYTKAENLPIGSQEWRDLVNGQLLDGYGVEDISLWLDTPARAVRAHVADLRAKGTLAKWWRK
ncbi:hypothetical protein [Dinoroseobacter sp. S124A]|uniref:hypothetical protein n=1 Tax=Dinoroseobacter sp. S124A TaxID=3415128 RepID=UPI003C7E4687